MYNTDTHIIHSPDGEIVITCFCAQRPRNPGATAPNVKSYYKNISKIRNVTFIFRNFEKVKKKLKFMQTLKNWKDRLKYSFKYVQ